MYHSGRLSLKQFTEMFALRKMCYREEEKSMNNTKSNANFACLQHHGLRKSNNMRDETPTVVGLMAPHVPTSPILSGVRPLQNVILVRTSPAMLLKIIIPHSTLLASISCPHCLFISHQISYHHLPCCIFIFVFKWLCLQNNVNSLRSRSWVCSLYSFISGGAWHI